MDRKRNSEKEEPQEHPIEPEMEKRPGENPSGDEPPKEHHSSEL